MKSVAVHPGSDSVTRMVGRVCGYRRVRVMTADFDAAYGTAFTWCTSVAGT